MNKQKEENSKFPIKLFIIASMAGLFSLLVFVLFVKANSVYLKSPEADKNDTRYYFKEADRGDPFITSVPTLRDILSGPIIDDMDPGKGPKDAEVVLVQYSDFKCDYCHDQEIVLEQIMKDYEGKVRLIWKDYPDYDKETESRQAAIAGRCAQEQGKFWEYHDALYDNNEEITRELLVELAGNLKLKRKTFEECLDDEEINDLVESNILEAQALDIIGIPFVYINDKEVMGNRDYEEIREIIESELSN